MGFDDLFGNKRIKHILSSYLRNDIAPHSIIFSGPRSANLSGFAFAFAKAINCLDSKDDFCGQCRHCVEADHHNFPDLMTFEPDGQFYKKEQITFLVEDNVRKPLKGNRKIYILDHTHKMNPNSANAFLKVLEEPNLSNMFILLTTNLMGLLPTIKSRCQILRFSPLSRAEIKDYFIKQGDDPETARLKAYLGQSNIESVLSGDFKTYMKKRAEILDMLTALILNRGVDKVLTLLFNKSRSREKFIQYFKECINLLSIMLRDIMILHIDESDPNLINIDYKEHLMKLKPNIDIQRTLFLVRKMEYLLRDVHRNLNSKVLIQEFITSYSHREVQHV